MGFIKTLRNQRWECDSFLLNPKHGPTGPPYLLDEEGSLESFVLLFLLVCEKKASLKSNLELIW